MHARVIQKAREKLAAVFENYIAHVREYYPTPPHAPTQRGILFLICCSSISLQ